MMAAEFFGNKSTSNVFVAVNVDVDRQDTVHATILVLDYVIRHISIQLTGKIEHDGNGDMNLVEKTPSIGYHGNTEGNTPYPCKPHTSTFYRKIRV